MKSLGYEFVCRYLSFLPNGKVIDQRERDALLGQGIDIALNWEYDAHDQLGGWNAGNQHATEAVRQARILGYPSGASILYSADWDVSSAQWFGPVSAYQHAARAVTNAGGYRFGVYGGYNLIKWSLDAGIAQDAWQTYAWSYGRWDARATVRQIRNGVNVLGVDCDINETVGPVNFWRHREQSVAQRPHIQKEEFMLIRGVGTSTVTGKARAAVYSTNGQSRVWLKTPTDVADVQGALKAAGLFSEIVPVGSVANFGPLVGDAPTVGALSGDV